MKEELCRAFCNDLSIQSLPRGLAVSTVFEAPDGDPIGFYVLKQPDGTFSIEDDGVVLPALEASGVDFRSGTRGTALFELLAEYGVEMDEQDREFRMPRVSEADIPAAAMRFVAFSLRVRDFMLMTEYRVASTFREDAGKMLRTVIGDRAPIAENEPVSDALSDFNADFVIRMPGRLPVGVFLGTSESRILEALFVHMRARHEVHFPCSLVALIEHGRSISNKVRQQASNRLNALTEFRGDEVAAIQRIAYEALGNGQRPN